MLYSVVEICPSIVRDFCMQEAREAGPGPAASRSRAAAPSLSSASARGGSGSASAPNSNETASAEMTRTQPPLFLNVIIQQLFNDPDPELGVHMPRIALCCLIS